VIITAHLRDPVEAHRAFESAWGRAKEMLQAGKSLVMIIRAETRSKKQNRYLHAMLGDIAKQAEWAGKKRDTETWKRLLTAAWCRARNEHIEILPALDGQGVDIVYRRTSELSRAECAEMCDFVAAWCAHNGVELRDAAQWVDPETGEIFGR